MIPETVAPPVERVWWGRTEPHVNGAPLSREQMIALFKFATGGRVFDLTDRISREADSKERASLVREAEAQEARIRDVASAFCAVTAHVFDLPPEIVELRLVDGRVADPKSLDFRELRGAGLGSGGGFEGQPPRLGPR